LVEAAGCPVRAPDLGLDQWLDHMRVDKKTEGGELRFVLLPEIGRAEVRPVPAEALAEVLDLTVARAGA
jgi:3-dehydroquinate synthase